MDRADWDAGARMRLGSELLNNPGQEDCAPGSGCTAAAGELQLNRISQGRE